VKNYVLPYKYQQGTEIEKYWEPSAPKFNCQ